jgi:hypothetical protein
MTDSVNERIISMSFLQNQSNFSQTFSCSDWYVEEKIDRNLNQISNLNHDAYHAVCEWEDYVGSVSMVLVWIPKQTIIAC